MAERRFEAGETIYTCGDPDRYRYFLTEGVLRLYTRYAGHKEATVTLLEEGNVFGEPALQPGSVHRDSAEAAATCRVAAVGKAALEHLIRRDPRCALALVTAYALWVQRRERAITRLIPRQIRPRLAASLLELADRFGEPTEGGVLVRVCLTHQMLADMAASSRVGISNEVARFQHESLIETRARGTIVVRDLRRLSDIARGK